MKSISKILLAYILIYKLENISTFDDSEYVEPSTPFYTKKLATLNLYDRRTTAQIQYTNDMESNEHIFVPKEGFEIWEVVFVGPQLSEFNEKNRWRSENSSTTAVKVVEKATEAKDVHVEIYLKNGNTISFFTYTVKEQKQGRDYMIKTTTTHQKNKTNNGYKIVTTSKCIVGVDVQFQKTFWTFTLTCAMACMFIVTYVLFMNKKRIQKPKHKNTESNKEK
nr:hypothetical protein MACL_00001793 [Theileria orientalis]